MFLAENGADGLEQIVLLPSFQNDCRPLFARRSLKFGAGILGAMVWCSSRSIAQIEPFLRTRLHLEAHARCEPAARAITGRADW